MAMVVALLLALEYDLFSFIEELSEPQRKISLAEAIFLYRPPCAVDRHLCDTSIARGAPRRRASGERKKAGSAVKEAGVARLLNSSREPRCHAERIARPHLTVFPRA